MLAAILFELRSYLRKSGKILALFVLFISIREAFTRPATGFRDETNLVDRIDLWLLLILDLLFLFEAGKGFVASRGKEACSVLPLSRFQQALLRLFRQFILFLPFLIAASLDLIILPVNIISIIGCATVMAVLATDFISVGPKSWGLAAGIIAGSFWAIFKLGYFSAADQVQLNLNLMRYEVPAIQPFGFVAEFLSSPAWMFGSVAVLLSAVSIKTFIERDQILER